MEKHNNNRRIGLILPVCCLECQGYFLSLIGWHLGEFKSVSARLNMNTGNILLLVAQSTLSQMSAAKKKIFTTMFTTANLFINE